MPKDQLLVSGAVFLRVPQGEFLMGSMDDGKLAWDLDPPTGALNNLGLRVIIAPL